MKAKKILLCAVSLGFASAHRRAHRPCEYQCVDDPGKSRYAQNQWVELNGAFQER